MKDFINNLKKILQYRFLLNQLVARDIKIKYRKSFLGIVWSLLNPLLMMVIVSMVFANIFRFSIKNFPIYLLIGQIVFNYFSEATNMAMTAIIYNGSLIRKVYLPKFIFPLSKIISAFINLMFSIIAIFIVMLVTNTKIHWTILLLPIPVLYCLIFSIGVGLIVSAYAVFFRDLVHLYSVLLLAWSYLTPIIYPIDIIPKKYVFIIKLNPLYYIIDYFRQLILNGNVPSASNNLICLSYALVFLFLGILVFKRKENQFVFYV